jgi:cytochrome c oxidase assembly protein Cox11
MEVKAEIINYNQNLIFSTLEPELKVFGNEKKTITYRAKNLSRKTIKIQPHLIIDPEYTEEYITRYECLCSRSYRLKPQEEIELKMEFEISEDIFRNPKFDKANPITIRYKIESLNTVL